jgi:hypothetical protein
MQKDVEREENEVNIQKEIQEFRTVIINIVPSLPLSPAWGLLWRGSEPCGGSSSCRSFGTTCKLEVFKCLKSEIKQGDHTKIAFRVDLVRFWIERINKSTIKLISRRVYGVVGSMASRGRKNLAVRLNGKRLPLKGFWSYFGLFDGATPPLAFIRINKW